MLRYFLLSFCVFAASFVFAASEARAEIRSLSVFPERLVLESSRTPVRVIVTGLNEAATATDVTDQVTLKSADERVVRLEANQAEWVDDGLDQIVGERDACASLQMISELFHTDVRIDPPSPGLEHAARIRFEAQTGRVRHQVTNGRTWRPCWIVKRDGALFESDKAGIGRE